MGTLAKNLNASLTLAERLKKKRTINERCLLLDTSGSMNSYCDRITTKIEALKKILSSLKCKHMYAFSSFARRYKINENLYAAGGTNLYPALLLMKEDKQKEGIIITDGAIQDQDLTLKFLEENPDVKLQVIYVGPKDYKPSFLDTLAEKTGGLCTVEDLASPKELAEKITLLLGSGKEDETSIQL